ncbi:MAG: helix-turn-helix domain-containing protein [Bacteroidales bacterium]|nr:helix-turn-helix domain-containing protein [Bacteroidales bacterium]
MKERLRILMQTYGINQTELAQRIGVSKMTISHIMSDSGRGGGFKQETIEAFKRAFPTLDINWLIKGYGTAPLPMDESSLFSQPAALNDGSNGNASSEGNQQHNGSKKQYQSAVPDANLSANTDISDYIPVNQPEREFFDSKLGCEDNSSQNTDTKVVDKKITRIVLFFDDGTFRDYRPE